MPPAPPAAVPPSSRGGLPLAEKASREGPSLNGVTSLLAFPSLPCESMGLPFPFLII